MAEDRFARLRNASLALKFSISIGDVTINYDGVLDACSEVERLRVRLETAERDRDTANEDATFQHNAAVAAEAEIERLQKLIGELRGAMPLEKLGGDDPEWLADLKRRAAEAAKGES